jgi:hypothetical protein
MFKRLKIHPTSATLQSYLGMLKHGNVVKLEQNLLNTYYVLAENQFWYLQKAGVWL